MPRPFVPLSLRKKSFDQFHELSYPGVKASSIILKSRYFWQTLSTDFKIWVSGCIGCQKEKVPRHQKTEYRTFYSTGRFETVRTYIVGPLPPCSKFV
uniref:Putative LOC101163551 [Oryzias latipes] n=1 Tax=Lepeophtheirus salmonis TaxID=72036 RepID=A0A0K2VBN8_LEPSM